MKPYLTLNELMNVMTKATSTCLKREVTCIMTDTDNNVVSVEKNQCTPPDGVCTRLGVVTNKANYLPTTNCNSEHAEVRALKFARRMPARAYLIGHRFFCDDCEQLLRGFGIELHVIGENQ